MSVEAHLVPALALVLGTFVHILKKVIQERQANNAFHLNDYLMAWPYQTIVSVLMSVGGYLGLMAMGELTPAAAFLMGVTANSIAGAAPGNRP